jgi:CelD/BcsL family acetyltransferase involved in cellulose biosynthesis
VQLAATASRSGIALRAYDNVEEISTEWRGFEERADLTVFQSFDWLANWQRHIGSARGTVPAIVIGSEADGEVLFILQLAIYTTGPVRRLRWLGSQLCDYNAPLLAQDFSARTSAERFRLAWRDVIGLLRSDPFFHFDVIDLAKMPEWIGEQRNPFMDLRVRAPERRISRQPWSGLGHLLCQQALCGDPQARAAAAAAARRPRGGALCQR